MEQGNPYVGPRAFRGGEQLYGRDRERRDLLNLLIAERIVLVYSPSGAGKTSLIQAALVPDLESEEFQVLPIIRVGAAPPPGSTANRYVFSTIASLEAVLPAAYRDPAASGGASLAEVVAAIPRPEGNRILLIFDQFEEVFTADAADSGDRREFFIQLAKALNDSNVWALIAMREDYIASLDPYSGLLPTRLANRFRLDLLGPDAAIAAIEAPAVAAGAFIHPEAASRLVDNLRQIGGEPPRLGPHVEPVHLQIACLELWERMQPVWLERGKREIGADDIHAAHDVDEALGHYYDMQLGLIAAAEPDPDHALFLERRIREWFERRLITPEGVRAQVLKGSVESGELGQTAIDALLAVYLVRTDERRNAIWYELAHDRLVQPIRVRNAEWLREHFSPFRSQAELWRDRNRDPDFLFSGPSLDEAEAWAGRHPGLVGPVEAEFLAACQKSRLDRHRERRRRLAVVILALVASVSTITTLYYFYRGAEARAAAEMEVREGISYQARLNAERNARYRRLFGTLEEFRARAARERNNFLMAFDAERRAARLHLSALSGEIERSTAEATQERERNRAITDKIQSMRHAHPELEQEFASLFHEIPRPTAAERVQAVIVQQARDRSGNLARARPNNPWGLNLWAPGSTLRVRFLDGLPSLRQRVLAAAREWTRYANLNFEESDAPDAEIRITFEGPGPWSYLGTYSLGIAQNQPTMTMGWIGGPAVSDPMFRQGVLHTFGTAIGLINEQHNPNAAIPWNQAAVYEYFRRQGWVREAVASLIAPAQLPRYRAFDPHSIMVLGRFPRQLFTRDFALEPGEDLSPSDRQFVAELYPGR